MNDFVVVFPAISVAVIVTTCVSPAVNLSVAIVHTLLAFGVTVELDFFILTGK